MRIKHDYSITIALCILVLVGVVTILTTNVDVNGRLDWGGVVSKQIIFALIGFGLYWLVSKLNFVYLKYPHVWIPLYLVTLVLLLLTLFLGPEINGAKRWLLIGGTQLQPSEIAKITIILVTANILSYRNRFNQWVLVLLSGLALTPILILVFLQPHGSMTLILAMIWGIVVFTYLDNQLRNFLTVSIVILGVLGILLVQYGLVVVGIISLGISIILTIFGLYSHEESRKFFFGAASLAVIIGTLLATVGKPIIQGELLQDYQLNRIEAFRNPEKYSSGLAFNTIQSQIAIGSGKLLGKGLGYSTQGRLNFLPEHQTDFIFAIFAEQFGFVGAIFLIAVFMFLVFKFLWVAMANSRESFSALVSTGIAVKLLIEVFVSIGVNTGVIPATGIPLPLISAGGTITLVTFVSFGLIQSIINSTSIDRDTGEIVDNDDLLI
ncbi:rod shape-determining protein RodA [Candidatus Nomurabacteria bacterium]|nr:rod shape-determining protein RodA [Candidatus Nomurabacteria bacterium]